MELDRHNLQTSTIISPTKIDYHLEIRN